jgi:dTMP kinase
MTRGPGIYSAFEGVDGSGKSTQAKLATEYLIADNEDTIMVAEPGGTPIGEALRTIIKNGDLSRDPISNLELFTICRHELGVQVITPALLNGTTIVSDRTWHSSDIYQGRGEGLDRDLIYQKTLDAIADLILPDLLFVILVPLEVIEERMMKRGSSAQDYFEQKGESFYRKLIDGYAELAERSGVVGIDGAQSEDKVHSDVMREYRLRFPHTA